MYNKLLKWSGVIGISVLMVMIVGMLFYSSQKTLVYVQAEETPGLNRENSYGQEPVRMIDIQPEQNEKQDRFMIPVADMVTQDSIYFENDYINQKLTITIAGMDTSFYEKTAMFGNLTGILGVKAGNQGSSVVILLSLDGVYEYEVVLENQKIGLALKKPSEVYDRILVLDVGHGGDDRGIVQNGVSEDELVMDVAERIRAKLEESDIRVYMTRGYADAPEMSDRAAFALMAEADMVLSLHLSDGTEYGISAYYNDLYFTPDLTNAEFADLLVRNTAEAVHNRGNGIYPMEDKENELLCGVTVPAAELLLGCPGNEQEAKLLTREDYKEDLAEGVCLGIMEGFEEIEE